MSTNDAVRAGREALLIANGKYEEASVRDLHSPIGDVAGLQSVLSDPAIGNFVVHPVLDEYMAHVMQQIERFFKGRHPRDELLLYITCHGVRIDDELRFATPITDIDKDVRATTIPDAFVWDSMAASRAGSIVLILDCCFSGAFDFDLSAMGGVGDRAALCACSHIEYAQQGARGSIFTTHLVDGLRNGDADLDGDGFVSVEELHKYVYDQMIGCGDLTPTRKVHASGNLVIAKSPRPRSQAPPPPPPVQIVMEPAQHLHHEGVRGVAFAGATLLASVGGDGTVRLWDVATSPAVELWRRPPSHRWLPARSLRAVHASVAAGLIATACEDGSACVRDLTGAERQVVAHPEIRAVTLSHDGRLLATAGDDCAACVWDVCTGIEELHIQDTAPLNCVSFDPDATLLARGGDDHLIRVWDLVDGTPAPRHELPHGAAVWGVAFSPDGRNLVSVSGDGSARVWELLGREPRPIEHGCAVFCVAFSPDGGLLATAGDDIWAHTWNLTGDHEVKRLRHTAHVWATAFSPDGSLLATASADGAIRVWSM